MKVIALFLVVSLASCQGHSAPEACSVLNKTLYRDGEFKLTRTEALSLERKTGVKLAAIMLWHSKNCH